jgi:lincosamide nucleotidyltransferase A/C/D/E
MTMRAQDVVEVIDALENAGVQVWVDGGWGVDAVLGEQTRQHDDLDVVVGVDDVPRLVVVLADLRYTEIRTWPDSPEVFVLRAADDRRIDVHPVRFNEHGDGLQQIEGGKEWAYPARGFGGAGTVGGRPARCLTPEVQVLCHAGYELKDSDAHDMRALRDRFGVDLLPEQREAISSRDAANSQ